MHNENNFGLFDEYYLLEKLTKLKDPLQKLDSYLNFQFLFEEIIENALKNETIDPSKGGRTPFKKMILFKGILIQSLYNLSDEQLEFQIVDRASFKCFLGLKCSDKVPDSRTFWAFREQLIKKDLISKLFEIFKTTLEAAGIIANEGQIIDASFVDVPRQRNNREENKHIKDTGTAPEKWNEKPHKLAQKDITSFPFACNYASIHLSLLDIK
jgi:transposase